MPIYSPGGTGSPACLPLRLDELRGPVRGVIVLPRHLSWPGMREFDLSDDGIRRSMYGIVLTQGQALRGGQVPQRRAAPPGLAVIRASLDPKLRRWCERQFSLG